MNVLSTQVLEKSVHTCNTQRGEKKKKGQNPLTGGVDVVENGGAWDGVFIQQVPNGKLQVGMAHLFRLACPQDSGMLRAYPPSLVEMRR